MSWVAWQLALLIVIVVLQLALGGGLLLLLTRRPAAPPPAGSHDGLEPLRKDLADLERRLDSKFNLLLTQVTSQGGLSASLTSLTAALQERSRAPEPAPPRPALETSAVAPAPLGIEPASALPTATPRIEALLSHADFLSGTWSQMDGDFHAASSHLRRYLAERSVTEPRIEPYPEMQDGNPNHWIFLVVEVRDEGAGGARLLVPRNFSRYDPSLHDHLFEVRGRQATLDNFIRELQKCARLKPTGALQGFIEKDLVDRKGAVVV